MYDIATYTRANIEKTANSHIHLDARSDYSIYIIYIIIIYITSNEYNYKYDISTQYREEKKYSQE